MALNNRTLQVIILGSNFKVGRRSLPKMPFVMDNNGYPHKLINRFLLDYEVLTMKRHIEQTVTEKARGIVIVYNELNRTVTKDSHQLSDQVKTKDKFHDLWRLTTEARLLLIQNNMEVEKKVKNSTINTRFSAFCHFIWWAEKKGYSNGLIGFNNLDVNKESYQVPVKLPREKSKHSFQITWQLRGEGPAPLPIGMIKRHDQAYDALLNKGFDNKSVFIAQRDLLLLRCLRECALRKEECVSLECSEFTNTSPLMNEKEDHVWLYTSKTKGANKDKRRFPCPVDLFWDVQNYIENTRDELIPESVKQTKRTITSSKVFVSTKTGEQLNPRSVNPILKPYGIAPQSSRKTGLTEMAMALTNAGYNKASALFVLGEIAGHSIKSKGETVESYYLMASDILKKGNVTNTVGLKLDLMRAEKEIEELKKKLNI